MQTSDQRMMEEVGGLVTVRRTHDRKNFNLDTTFELPAVADFVVGLPAPKPKGTTPGAPCLHIALQFPDSMLGHSVRIVDRIQTLLVERGRSPAQVKLFALADNTYGDCCPDEVTAEHYFADAIVHFGSACLSKSVRFPIHYVFAKMTSFNVQEAAQQAVDYFNKLNESGAGDENVVIVMSTATVHHKDDLTTAIRNLGAHVHVPGAATGSDVGSSIHVAEFSVPYSQLPGGALCTPCAGGCGETSTEKVCAEGETQTPASNNSSADSLIWTVNGFKIPRQCSSSPVRPQKIFFVGPTDSPMLNQLSLIAMHNEMTLSQKTDGIEFLRVLDSSSWESGGATTTTTVLAAGQTSAMTVEIPNAKEAAKASGQMVQKRIRQRMFNMESLKKAQSVGVIVASLAIEGFRETAEKLRTLLIKHKKRCYIIFVGHLSPLKTGNFADSIDCFVTIACPNARLAQFTDKRDEFLQPMLTPIEVLMAFGYVDFDHPLAFSTSFSTVLTHDTTERKRRDSESDEDSDAEDAGAAGVTGGRGQLVSTRPLNVAVTGHAAGSSLERFNEKMYRGLETRTGETAVQAEIVQGKHGIARGYETTEVEKEEEEK